DSKKIQLAVGGKSSARDNARVNNFDQIWEFRAVLSGFPDVRDLIPDWDAERVLLTWTGSSNR
ncbi:hypothetical protein, partial [Nioella sp.]|uniref:hypothetical protein n=1 Tax=Nioella sp. TaxID=1912091 RepID=UPI003519C966